MKAKARRRVQLHEISEEGIVEAMGGKVCVVTLLPSSVEQREQMEAFVAMLDIDSPLFGLVTVEEAEGSGSS